MATRQIINGLYLCILCALHQVSCVVPYDIQQETTLRNILFSTYDRKVRPRSYTEVNMTLVLLSLNDLNIGEQAMSTTAILVVEWLDERLNWNRNMGGVTGLTNFSLIIKSMTVDATEVWIPPIVADNVIGQLEQLAYNRLPISVFHEGRVIWRLPITFETGCDVSILYFPFETQTCGISLLALDTADKLSISTRIAEPAINMNLCSQNAAWEYLGGFSGESYLTDDSGSYKRLSFNLTFRRRWLFLTMTLMLPTVLNLLLMLGVFFLSIESGEKMGYSLTVLLSYIVLLTLVGDTLPDVSTQISFLQIYLACVLIVGCLSTLLTVWTISVFHKDDDKQPISDTARLLIKWILLPGTGTLFWKMQCSKRKTPLTSNNRVHSWSDSTRFEGNVPHQTLSTSLSGKSHPLRHLSSLSTEKGSSGSDTAMCEGIKKDPLDKVIDTFTWKDIAAMMDSFFVRVLGSALLLSTIFFVAILFALY